MDQHSSRQHPYPRGRLIARTRACTNGMLPQILVVGACSLALSLNSVSCNDDLSRPSSVSYPQQYALSQTSREFRQQYDQLLQANQFARPGESRQSANYYPVTAAAASAPSLAPYTSGSVQPATKPSVYHSIIDRTDAGSTLNVSPAIQTSTSTNGDLKTAAGHHHGHTHGKYYEYRAVPKKKTWKFGYKRGNHKHTISRHEHGKAGKHPHFKTKVKWHDKKSKGKGIHLWDYNHHDKKHYHHG